MSTDYKAYYNSPIGVLEISGSEEGIKTLSFTDLPASAADGKVIPDCLKECFRQLDEYFSGKRLEFKLNLIPQGTDFQKRVWNELLRIPFGHTISYIELSRRLGDIKAVRAVGGANGKNPIAIVIPCHRVIGEDGSLTGFGGGIWRKRWLLNHEGSLNELFP